MRRIKLSLKTELTQHSTIREITVREITLL